MDGNRSGSAHTQWRLQRFLLLHTVAAALMRNARGNRLAAKTRLYDKQASALVTMLSDRGTVSDHSQCGIPAQSETAAAASCSVLSRNSLSTSNGWGQDSCQSSLDNVMKQLQTQDRFAFSQMLEKVMTGAMKVKNAATIDMHSSNDAAAHQVSLPL